MGKKSWAERLLSGQEHAMTEKQRRVVIAAIELFGEKGYASVSTREIAQRAAVAEGTIFKHYATKKELLLSVSRLIIDHFLLPSVNEGLDALADQSYARLEDFLSALLENRLTLIRENLLLLKVVLQEALFQPELKAEFARRLGETALPRGLENLKTEGLIIDLPAEDLLKMVLTGFFGFVFIHYILMPEFFPDTAEDRKHFIGMMARGLQSPGGAWSKGGET
ncbi:MAG: TetR/AcrR family transcriptional regulator [Gracilibacteraceae bacterium]|nr:TetR/AcrR family transcriptional regulator [Gracilibacteraceae bacterium]